MVEPVTVGVEAASQIAAFTRVACAYDLLSTTSVERSIFDDPDPTLVLAHFDPGLEAVGAAVVRGEHGFVKFLAVHPRSRLRGLGSQLLVRLEDFCRQRGASTVSLGPSAPFYVVPGIDVRYTEALIFAHARGYRRTGDSVNQGVRLVDLPDPALPCHVADASDLDRIMPWLSEHYPNWIAEVTRSVQLGTCIVHDDLGFACYDANRAGWFGPMATRPELRGKQGVGTATLLAVLHKMRALGYEHCEIAWSGAVGFYLKVVGARISRVFWTYAKSFDAND
jgi:GNAT superfamily N-acetyltransferase